MHVHRGKTVSGDSEEVAICTTRGEASGETSPANA